MNSFFNDIKKLVGNLTSSNVEITSEKSLESGIQISRTTKCCKNNKDVSYYVSKFDGFELDKREFIRIIIEIPSKNNVRSQNIEMILNYMRLMENYFVFTDYIKIYFGDGLIHIDTYTESAQIMKKLN